MEPHELGVIALLTKRFTELQASFRTLSKQAGPAGQAGKDGVSITGAKGADGKDGRDGKDGKSVKGTPGKDGADGKDGEQGPTGSKPNHKWTGTKLQFEKPDGKWGRAVDLKGDPGKDSGNVTKIFGVGGDSSFNPDSLPIAGDLLPEEFIVKQDGVWVRATYAQMQTWLGGGVVADRVLVGTDRVMVGDQIVRVTE